MIDQITCALPKGNDFETVQLFGYSSKGIPGLEIVGLGQQGRTIKEKIIFINKKLNLEIPRKRYLICLETELLSALAKKEKQFIELPVWLLYLKLTENLPIHSLRDVLSGGRLQVHGGIDCLNFNIAQISAFNTKGLIPVVKASLGQERVFELPEIIHHLELQRH